MAYVTVMGIDPTEVHSTPEFMLGQLGAVVASNATKVYKYVQYDTGSGSVAAASGNAAYYYTLDGYKLNQVTSDLSDSGRKYFCNDHIRLEVDIKNKRIDYYLDSSNKFIGKLKV